VWLGQLCSAVLHMHERKVRAPVSIVGNESLSPTRGTRAHLTLSSLRPHRCCTETCRLRTSLSMITGT
jgi:hypothetical protein